MTDRAAALRRAVRVVVAERGLHGASMSAIAREAGVAIGTAYVHYDSKDELVIDTYLEVKRRLGEAVVDAIDAAADPAVRFGQLWRAAYRFFEADVAAARFLVQFESSPLNAVGHARAMAVAEDPLALEAARPDIASRLIDLSPPMLYDLALGPAVRAVAGGERLDDRSIDRLANACWRAITAESHPLARRDPDR